MGGNAGHGAQLGAGQVALLHAHGDGGVARLALLDGVGFEPLVVGRGWSRGRTVQHRKCNAWARLPRIAAEAAETFGHQLGPRDAAVGQDVGVLAVDFFLEPGKAAVAHQEFEPRQVAVLAVAVLVEDADHGFDTIEEAVFGQEIVEELSFAG